MLNKTAIRIANVSGGTGDVRDAMYRMVTEGENEIDAVTGDWLSEMNIAWNAMSKLARPDAGYEQGFYDQLEQSIEVIARKQLKVVTNAGGLNTPALARKVEKLLISKGIKMTVAYVEGDDVTELIRSKDKADEIGIRHLDSGVPLTQWGLEPLCGVAYIGAKGITAALKSGADIVICGRVTDASPVLGLAAYWFGWQETDYNQLAGALMAGHIIECGSYATGANYTGFKKHLPNLINLGYPIAEVNMDGSFVVTKHKNANGVVEKFNITAQLLYEIQGEIYLNPDVSADLSQITVEEIGENRVFVSGAKGSPPSTTTKAMIAAVGGWQAETSFYVNGIDVEAKVQFMKQLIETALAGLPLTKLSIELYGSAPDDPTSQQSGTRLLRVFAQARDKDTLSAENFKIPVYMLRMQSFPGYHMSLDFRTMDPKMYMELFPALIPIETLSQRVVFPDHTLDIDPPVHTKEFNSKRPSYDTKDPIDLSTLGPTLRAPLGTIVHGRSGDKGNNCNVGLFVRSEDEFIWLKSFLSLEKFRTLLGQDAMASTKIERCEFKKIWAVHFRIIDFLDGGIASSSRVDNLGKGVAEYIRSRQVEIPKKFLDLGAI